MVTAEADKLRTYGGWRRPDKGGLGTLSSVGTILLIVGPIFAILIFLAFDWAATLIYLALYGVVMLVLTIRDRHHRTLLHRIGARVGGTKSGVYRTGALARVPWGRHQLPGVLARSELTEHRDAYGRPFAILHYPATKHYVVVLRAEPDGMSLVDQETVDQRVAHWGHWLSNLGTEPGLDAASVTVETAPDSGSQLRREIASNVSADAPELAKAMFSEVLATYPSGSATVRGYVTLTYRGDSRRRRNAQQVAVELASRIPILTGGLDAAGAGAAAPLSAQELCEAVRIAYDPTTAGLLEQARSDQEVPALTWDDVGPVAAAVKWDSYRHDSGTSRTWEMTRAPQGEVYSDVLRRLLDPSPALDRKRVTIHYRPYDPARAAVTVEADVDKADFRVTGSNRPTARARSAQRAAAQTAKEEARGAGLVAFSMLVTATVGSEGSLVDAGPVVENLATSARIQLRTVYGSQDSAFAAALPVGLVLDQHSMVPSSMREML